MLTAPHFRVAPPATSDDLLAAVPTFVRFYRAFQALDAEGRSCVVEMMSCFDDESTPAVQREHAREVIVEALFADR